MLAALDLAGVGGGQGRGGGRSRKREGVHLCWQVNEAPGSEEVWRDGASHGASQRPGPPLRPWILAWEDWS